MHIDSRAALLRDRLRGMLVAAAATPMTAAGEVDLDLADAYLRGLVADGADALAVLAHTGRGPFLTPEVRAGLIGRAVATGVPVVVGVGGSPGTAGAGGPSGAEGAGGSPAADPGTAAGADAALARMVAEARTAADLGADAVLVFPADDPVAAHDAIWRSTGLPMIAFDLYVRPYPADVLRRVVGHPGVAGLKTALLSDAMGCQEAIALTRAAGRLAITGEDRMFGPSLLWGAEAALVGIAAARVEVTAEVLRAFTGSDLRRFEWASARLDRLAAATFTEPMEGYVQRMLWLAAAEGRIPDSHAHDPYGPGLAEDRELLVAGERHVRSRTEEAGDLSAGLLGEGRLPATGRTGSSATSP
ncbi:dihydrodipicolinate synthase family protein [Streptosporangium sp. NBC_01756]|uniref:dihydrodipicolinate synthase family protein n=1 Tax=Streptosporangium sp. NBC_01756 TaxID=2975950 RepID=UPI002DD9C12B|nr:dihydrodipicolinate synthase family protein [Streptosporangium sp. NBC_01756]WSC84589.1 dihydrodipicolinate synthase family protein [Streptosporangium sp. NBC_01756]